MFQVLNVNLKPVVPMTPTADPEVHVFNLHGEHVLFDANSLCAVRVDECTAHNQQPAQTELSDGRLLSRMKPQFRMPRTAPVRRLVLNVTHACNLACAYCFAGGDRAGEPMNLDTARQALQVLDPKSPVDIAFFGGEPLLAWDLVHSVMEEATALAEKRGVPARFHITTNALRLNEEKIAFLAGHPCSLLVSLDGPEEMHNASRPARNPEVNSFAAVMQALERVRGTPLASRTMARATFTADQARLRERLEFLQGLQDAGVISGFSAEPAVLTEGCGARATGGSDPTDQSGRSGLSAEYHAAAEWFVERAKAGQKAGFFHYRKLIQRILYARHAGTECGAGNGCITIGPDGTLYACHRESGTAIGHLDHGFDEERRSAWADNRVYQNPHCLKCWARYLCGGGCRQACLELADGLHAQAHERCFIQQTMLRECFWILTQLTREQIERAVRS